jgi:hypothetical protein
MRLPHRRRQLRFKAAIEFAKPRIAVTAGVGRDVSSQTISSVTCLRFSSRWTASQFGSAWRRCPRLLRRLA